MNIQLETQNSKRETPNKKLCFIRVLTAILKSENSISDTTYHFYDIYVPLVTFMSQE